VHDEHRIAGAPLGVLDRTPWGRDDVTFNCGRARARRVHVVSVTRDSQKAGIAVPVSAAKNNRFMAATSYSRPPGNALHRAMSRPRLEQHALSLPLVCLQHGVRLRL
jgi:hypothetical protein